jgi:RNA polymerase sigma factor (sigma-70 family)
LSNNTITQTLTDTEILTGLQSDQQRLQDQAFRAMYRQYFAMIEQFVLKNSGKADDAADVFQDGLMALFRKVREPDFELTASLKTLTYAICRNIWLMRLRKLKRETQLTEVHQETVGVEASVFEFLEDNDRNQLVARGLQSLGEDCKKVLSLYYFEKTRMKVIAQIMGYTNEQVAKNKKSRCMKKLREWVLQQPEAEEIRF